MNKSRGWAAVFLDDQSLAVATGRSAGNEINITLETSEPIPAAVDGAPAGQAVQLATAALRQRVDLREHRIVTAIGGEDVFCQTLRLPTADPGELQQMLAIQIDNLTPLPVEEVVYSFEALETLANETRVLVAVARKAAVNERVAALEAVGWQTEIVGVDAIAVFRELRRQGQVPADEKLNLLVLVSATTVNVLVHSAGKLVVVRSLYVGTENWGADVRNEIARTLVAAEVECPGRAAGQVLLATWSEAWRGAVSELAATWPGAQCLMNGSTPNVTQSVCLESARGGADQLNLLPDEWRIRRRKTRARRLLIRGAIAVGAVYLLSLVVFLTLMGVKKVQLNRAEREIRNLQPPFTKAREVQKTLVAMQKQLDTKYSVLEVMREVSQMMPETVKFNGFTFKRDDAVTLRAQAQSAGVATDYISRLERSELFSKVALGAMRSDPGTGLTKFDVTCSLKSAAPGPAPGTHGH